MKKVMIAVLILSPLRAVAQEVPDHSFILHRNSHEDRAGFTFSPLVTWTFQHVAKVLDGMPHSKAVGYYDVTGGLTLWNNNDGLGQVMCQAQGNFAGGTSSTPSIREAERLGPVIQYYENDRLNGTVILGFRTSYSF